MKDYIITFDKLNSQIGFNGKPYGAFNQIFVILQVIMITLIILALGFGVY